MLIYKKYKSISINRLAPLLIALALILLIIIPVNAAQLDNRYIKASDSLAGAATVFYDVGFDVSVSSNVGSLAIEFCFESPLDGDVCTPPSGFNISGTSINNQQGITDLTVNNTETSNNRLVLSRPAAQMFGPGSVNFVLNNITNPDFAGPYFARIYTYNSLDATGIYNNFGGVALTTTEPFIIDAEVPPFLYLCVGVTVPGYACSGVVGNYIDMGELSPNYTKSATSEFIVATNAGAGFSVFVIGTPPTSGNNIISGLTTPTASIPGQSQFGINLRNNSSPDMGSDPVGLGTGTIRPNYNIPNRYTYNNGDVIVSSNTTTLDRKFTTTYIVNVNQNQKPGVYSTTLLYTVLATF